jgi:energy-coupling factor transport system ATP-binding protein
VSIQVERVSFAYPAVEQQQALRDVSFSAQPGERIAIIGCNGAGKTTLTRIVNGLLRPTRGRVLVDGRDNASRTVAQIASQVSYAFQDPDDQIFNRDVFSEIAYGLPGDETAVNMHVHEAARAVGLEALLAASPYELSLSQRKLICTASAIARETGTVILDEPTAGQDAFGLARLSAVVAQLAGTGRTVLAVMHDMDFVVENFERTLVLRDGRIVADGPVAEVLGNRDLVDSAGLVQPTCLRIARSLGLGADVLTPAGLATDVAASIDRHKEVAHVE